MCLGTAQADFGIQCPLAAVSFRHGPLQPPQSGLFSMGSITCWTCTASYFERCFRNHTFLTPFLNSKNWASSTQKMAQYCCQNPLEAGIRAVCTTIECNKDNSCFRTSEDLGNHTHPVYKLLEDFWLLGEVSRSLFGTCWEAHMKSKGMKWS